MEFTTALYIRISSEDGTVGESDSVKNQRDLLNDFVKNNLKLANTTVLEFVDDGWSGTNFERPSVKEMLEQAKKGRIHCIIVKDFSRFGRNYIEVCDYLEQIFPFLGLRFISINDRYDSIESKGRTIGLETAFKTLLHDLYCKELSMKVTQGYRAKAKKGEYLCHIAPFGYKRSETMKNKLEIDEPAAKVVRRIFELAKTGMSMTDISSLLNSEGVPTPLMYRKNKGTDKDRGWNVCGDMNYWEHGAVTRILHDERFTGKLVSGKRIQTKLGRGGSKDLPKSEWIVVEDVHEPIISAQLFKEVQAMLTPYKTKNYKRKKKHLYSGKAICGHCEHNLVYTNQNGVNKYYICNSSRVRNCPKCFEEHITEAMLSQAVLERIKQNHVDDKADECISQNFDEQTKIQEVKHQAKIKETEIRLEKAKHKKVALFEEYTFKKIDKEKFLTAKEACTSEIAVIETELQSLKSKQPNEIIGGKLQSNSLSRFVDTNLITSELIDLIDKIIVYNSNHIEVKFAFGS